MEYIYIYIWIYIYTYIYRLYIYTHDVTIFEGVLYMKIGGNESPVAPGGEILSPTWRKWQNLEKPRKRGKPVMVNNTDSNGSCNGSCNG